MLGGDFNLASLVKISQMKANKKTLILLGAGVALTLAAGGSYTFLFFDMKDKTEATSVSSEKIAELSGKESRLASSVSVLRRENANIENVSAYFFNESDIVTFTKKIEALGPQSGTTITIESLDKGVTEKTVPFLNFRIKATGKFADVIRLLVLLENFPGKFDWKTVRLVRDTDTASTASSTQKNTVKDPVWSVDAFLVALNFVNQ